MAHLSAIVRPALLSDAEGIARTHIQSWQAAYAELMPAEVIASRSLEQRMAQWSQWMTEHKDKSIWVAELDHKIVGFVAGGATRGVWAAQCPGEIYALYLQPEVFGQGLGGCLLQAMITHLKAQGYASQWVWVLTTNTKARAFYEKMGGVYETTTLIQIGDPPVDFEEVAYRFNDKSEKAASPLKSWEK
jgi:ribosomal protein S18 acetylase RimI-like enzyme